MRRVADVLAVLFCALVPTLSAACGGDYVPTSPSPPAPPITVVQPPLASLEIVDPYINLRPSYFGDSWSVEIRFLLRESTGESSATIRRIVVGEEVGRGDSWEGFCTEGLQVPPGGLLDTFYTDQGYEWLGYCAPFYGVVREPVHPSPVFVTVYFADDEGRVGQVFARAESR